MPLAPNTLTAEYVAAEAHVLLLSLQQQLGAAAGLQWLARVRPQSEDFASVFVPTAVKLAHRVYTRLWQDPPAVVPQPGQIALRVALARAPQLLEGAVAGFPRGYLQIAHLLQPAHTWVAWRFVEPGQQLGLAFDGLVYLDGRWAWFPKPYRYLAPVAQPLSHYEE